jgi:acyl carrier protein
MSDTPAPDDATLLALIQEIAEKKLGFSGSLTAETRIVEVLALDSVRLLTLVVELENRLGLCLDEGDEQGVETVAELMAVLRRRHGSG